MAAGDFAFDMVPMMDGAPRPGGGARNGPAASPANENTSSAPSGSGRDQTGTTIDLEEEEKLTIDFM